MKNKKIFGLILLIVICMIGVFVLSSCDEKDNQVDTTLNSLYNAAVENGYEGTYSEWLKTVLSSDAVSIASIEKTATNGNVDTYTITLTDGSKTTFNVTNGTNGANGLNGQDGKDAESITIQDLYETAQANGFTGTILEFIEDYCSVASDEKYTVAQNLLSSVIITSGFTYTQTYYDWFTGKATTQTNSATSYGSGIVYSVDELTNSAYIVTNYHVVYYVNSDTEDKISNDINIYLYGTNQYSTPISATYIGGSLTKDIAVLKIEGISSQIAAGTIQAVTFMDSDTIVPGETAIAIGNPTITSNSKVTLTGFSVTSGIVSVDSEYISLLGADESTLLSQRVIRVDTSINSGNSGGGLYNSQGDLMGLVDAKTSTTVAENAAYALPANTVKAVVESILSNYSGTNSKATKLNLGMTTSTKSSSATYSNVAGLTTINEVVAISAIAENSLAETKGLEVGDVIKSITINGTEYTITREFQVEDRLIRVRSGDTVVIKYIDADTTLENTITISVTNSDLTPIN